jgi:uncharacterized delta-60 repeat protein
LGRHPTIRDGNRRGRRAGATRHRAFLGFERLESRTLLAAGDLDPSFGVGGLAQAQFPNTTSNAVAIAPNGKLVVAGKSISTQGQDNGIAVAVYNPDGTLDPTFGNGGTERIYPKIGSGPIDTNVYGLAIQRDGKIVAAGYINNDSTPNDKFLVLRINPDGTLDSTFGVNGEAKVDFSIVFGGSGYSNGIAYGVALEPDGNIIAAGVAIGSTDAFAVAQFDIHGNLDGQTIVTSADPYAESSEGYCVAMQGPDRILVGGVTQVVIDHNGDTATEGAVIRLNGDLSPDNNFGPAIFTAGGLGYQYPGFAGGGSVVRGLAVQPNGDIVAAVDDPQGRGLTRLTADGYDDGGKISTGPPISDPSITLDPRGIAVDPDGRIIVAGGYTNSKTGDQGFFVERFHPDGSTDTSFGPGKDGVGIVLTSTGGGGTGVAVQSNGKIDVSGHFATGSSQGDAVAQYLDLDGTETSLPGLPGGLTQQPGPNVVVSGVTPSNPTNLPPNQVEGQIAINPTNPQNLAAVGADESIPFGQGIRVAISNDDGVTWSSRVIGTGAAPDHLPSAAGNNATIAFDRFGNLFIAYLTETTYQVNIVLSTDGGAGFQQLTQLGTGNTSDQPKIRTGPGGTEAPGSVWVEWADTGPGQLVHVAGAPVQGLGKVGGFNTETVPGSGGGDYGDIAVGPTGEVLVTYETPGANQAGPGKIWVNLDPDGLGSSGFGSAVLVTSTNVGLVRTIPAQAPGIDAEPKLAWDRSGGYFNGRLYLVYTDAADTTTAGTNIFVRTSTDRGMTWSAPVRVNDDVDQPSQFDPTIALDQITGNVAVSWYGSSPTDPTGAEFYTSVSGDGGQTFSLNAPVSNEASDAGGASLAPAKPGWRDLGYGDHSGSDFFGGQLFPIWSDNSLGPFGPAGSFRVTTVRIDVQPLSQVQFDAPTYSVNELAGTVTITVDRVGDPSVPVTVNYATSDGTGIAGTNYTAASGTLRFDVGAKSASFTVSILPYLSSAGNKTVNLTLSAPKGGTQLGGTTSAVLTILTQKATPKITWPNPAAITYGTALSSTQLDATASVPGTFQYTPGLGTVLPAGSGQKLSVTFTPTDAADYKTTSDSVTIDVNNKLTPKLVVHGVSATYDGNPHPATFTITGANGDNLRSLVSLTYNGSSSVPVHPGTYAVTASFPGNGKYNAVSDTSQQVVIAQVVPTITWPNPIAITYGTALSAAQLDATASVAGTFQYTPGPGTVLPAGSNQTLKVSFTPTDTADYAITSDSVSIDVNKLTPTLIVHGVSTTFDGNPHPATFTITGANGDNLTGLVSLTYNGSSALPVQAGTYTVTATFPGNGSFNAVSDTSQQVIIAQATPTITWAKPAAISAGTPLGAAQLDAGASVPGTFTYSRPAGTILGAGPAQVLSVTFTPTDAIDYQSATAQVSIDVLAPTTPDVLASPPPSVPHVTGIASGGHSKKGLTSIIVLFDASMDSGSAGSQGNYKVFGAVKRKKHTVYTKFVGIRSITYDDSKHVATITLSKPYKGVLQVTAESGIMGTDGTSTDTPFVTTVK